MEAETLIGRESEKKQLREALSSANAELIAVYGRRRVGKTFLIRQVFQKELLFEFSGIHGASLEQQLRNFTQVLKAASGSVVRLAEPENWQEAFGMLKDYAEPLLKEKQVLFFDEFPWIHTHKSGFLAAFGHFWNQWASRQKNLVIVICGSAASWMIREVVNNKGGLHNRITRNIRLLPFSLTESETYLKSRRIKLDRYQLLQLYMAMGGIPHYLKEIRPGQSATQNIDRICFTKDGLLIREFDNLYASLFEHADKHVAVIRALAQKSRGLTRNEIIAVCKFSSGGNTSRLLDELEQSGFINAYLPFNRDSKDKIYKLQDEYSLFYLKFIENSRATGAGTWIKLSTGASWRSWAGFAFESICLKHTVQIKKELGISGIYSEESIWRATGDKSKKGAQIDLLIDRQDHCINLCEMKFSVGEFTIDKQYASELQNKLHVFSDKTKTRKAILLTFITTYSVKENSYKNNLVQNEITMGSLFEN